MPLHLDMFHTDFISFSSAPLPIYACHRHKAVSALHKTSISKKKTGARKGKKREGSMDGFLLPGAKSHYAPDLMILPVHQGMEVGVGWMKAGGVIDASSDCIITSS